MTNILPAQGEAHHLGFFHFFEDTTADNSAMYCSIAAENGNATEANVQLTLPFGVRIIKMEVLVTINTKDEDIVFSFRDDAASVASLTITKNNGAEKVTSADLDIIVEEDSAIAMLRDTSASSSGNLAYKPLMIWYEVI